MRHRRTPSLKWISDTTKIVSEEEVVEKLARQQNAAFNRELRQLKEDLERSSRAMKRPGRTSSACKKLPEVENVRVEKQRAKSCSSEIEARLSTLSLDFHDQIQLEGERNESSTYSSDWHSEDEEPSDASSPSSASTILENKHVEEEEEEKLSLPPLMNVSKSAKDDLEIKSLRRCWLVWRAVTFRQKNMRRLKRDDDEKQSQIEQFVNRQTFVSKKTKSCSNLEQIIRDQKAKLREQERLISRLKLEQLRLEAEKSQQNAQTLMAHSLQDSSLPVRRKLKYLRSSFPDILDGGRVDNKSRPSFLVLMEQRQAERLRRKKELHERTQLRVEQQKRLQKEREEARRAELAEQRRLEQEARVEKMRLEAERRANEQAARAFCRLRRLRMAFRLFRAILLQRRRRIMEAEERRRLRLMGEAFRRWRQVVREKSQERMVQAKRHHRRKVMTFAWDKWTQAVMERKRDWQVAEDFSDLLFAVKLFKFGSHACLLEKRAEQIRREKSAGNLQVGGF
ncbi:calponin homology domain-containing protein DDB_G0272472-like isoform X2 [Neocloeon triangulifer]|uniref:calponin homology domain-containing protein DDB_G0272472-like isoform X2 n=1 Tax=Neocloeon triangulifer TaxID=2078957 RepID=UPI00286EFBAE|nr:calponin homology domain-containing protein DDB_G0272472-like isoform X2 [Neocloeon triangulifer]